VFAKFPTADGPAETGRFGAGKIALSLGKFSQIPTKEGRWRLPRGQNHATTLLRDFFHGDLQHRITCAYSLVTFRRRMATRAEIRFEKLWQHRFSL
jgi:hypothetical protein